MLDVIVPVYRGSQQTRRCLESVLGSAQSLDYELVVIDDATPEPELAAYLDQLARSSLITLIRNDCNLGFVGSANRGMSLHPDRDVVLLNSDTEVANDWLDRLHRCAHNQPDIGTVTPFSNNATICSYPFDGWQGDVPGALGLPALDRLVASCNAGRWVAIPTAVGFCMYVRRACIDQVGLFDEQRFGRGYGEENDFSLRASAAGWRNVLAADVFVYHAGSVSFGEERQLRQQVAMQSLLSVHPDYLERLGEFAARDPVRPFRDAIDLARMAAHIDERLHVRKERADSMRSRWGRPTQLHFTHSWEGGTNRWISEFCEYDGDRRNLVLRSISNRNVAGWRLELLEPLVADLPLMAWNLDQPVRATDLCQLEYQTILAEIVDTFDVDVLLVSSLIGHSLDVFDTALPTTVILHDLYPFCPALFAYFNAPCTECASGTLKSCMRRNSFNAFWHNTAADEWLTLRMEFAQRLSLPWVNIVAPTHSAWQRWTTLLPRIADMSCRVIAHGTHLRAPPADAETEAGSRSHGAKLRIVVPGRLLPHKGLALFAEALPEMVCHADFLLLGCGEFGRPFENQPGVEIVRTYSHQELPRHVEAFAPDAAMMVSVVPESFSYTMSEMLALAVPVIATNLGAFAERIEPGTNGLLVEANASALAGLVSELARDPRVLTTMRRNLKACAARHVDDMISEYHALLPARARNHGEPELGDPRPGVVAHWLARGARERQRLALENQHLRHQLDLGAARAAELEAALAGQALRSRGLQHQVGHVRAEKEAILGSRSWRWTAPLRGLSDGLRGLAGLGAERRRPGLPCEANGPPQANESVAPSAAGFEFAACKRDDARSHLLECILVPDASIIVLSLPADERSYLACRAAAVAKHVLAQRNDVVFVRQEPPRAEPQDTHIDTQLLSATRRLFSLPGSLDLDTAIMAADVILLDRAESVRRFMRLVETGTKLLVVAAECAQGLPVQTDSIRTISPDALERVPAILTDWFGDLPRANVCAHGQ